MSKPALKSSLPQNVFEELTTCPYCQSADRAPILEDNGYTYVECGSCSLLYLETRLRIEHLHLIYDDAAYHNVDATAYHNRVALKRLQLFPHLKPGSRIHEDGAGNGACVYQAQQMGMNATGSDFGRDAINKAKETYGVTLGQGCLEDQKIEPESLDALASFNLLCHLYQPWEYLKYVSSRLKPGGYFLLRTGNRSGVFKMYGWWGAPEHVYHFNTALLTKMLAAQGLKVIWTKPAFDCDFPHFLFDYAMTHTGLKAKIARQICGLTARLWTLLRLPKIDVYMLAKKIN